MMKYILIIILISMVAVLSCTPAPKSADTADTAEAAEILPSVENEDYQPGSWAENWDYAISAAIELERPILINFTGSDWCVWCIRLKDEVFSKAEFSEYAEKNLVLLTLDFPRNIAQSDELKQQNSTLQRQFGIQGFPTIVLIDPTAKEIARTGYRPGGAVEYVKHLEELLN